MSKILLSFNEEKIGDMDEMCELLGMTRSEYASYLFVWGKWILKQAIEGKVVLSMDDDTKICQSILSSPKLDMLIATSKVIKSLAQ